MKLFKKARFGLAVMRAIVKHPKNLRYLSRFRRSLARSPIIEAQPWMSFQAIDWLNATIQGSWRAFEFGSGGSTLFFASRFAHIISIEHDSQWYETVRRMIVEKGLGERCDYRLIAPKAISETPRIPSSRYSNKRADFERYVEMIDLEPDHMFNLIAIDGRARVECARRALPKVRSGGYVLLDNSSREDYRPIWKHYERFRHITFSGLGAGACVDSETTIWEIP